MKEQEIKIEHGIPIPFCSASPKWVDTIKKLKVGDSFVIPIKHRTNIGTLFARQNMKSTTRKIDDSTLRVWRTA